MLHSAKRSGLEARRDRASGVDRHVRARLGAGRRAAARRSRHRPGGRGCYGIVERRRRDCRHRDQAQRKSAGRADRDHRARRPRRSTICRSTRSTTMPSWFPRCRSSRRARVRPTSISAASRRARMPTTPLRCQSVGTYLDEQPITTIQGALDLHIFDIARVEALAGPQGTLVRRVEPGRHRPDHHQQARSGRPLRRGQPGGEQGRARRFRLHRRRLRQPAGRRPTSRRAWSAGTARTPATSTMSPAACTSRAPSITFDNNRLVEDNYNDVETYGARAALRIDLNDNWTVTPQIMAQSQVSNGSFAMESRARRSARRCSSTPNATTTNGGRRR